MFASTELDASHSERAGWQTEKKETAEKREPRETRGERGKYDDRIITMIRSMYTKDGYER